MGNGFIALVVAGGVGGWVYSKMMRSTGSNFKNSMIVAIIAGGFVFITALLLFRLVPSS